MKTTVEKITPAMATEWLESNYELNRPVRQGWVEQLASRIKEGHWRLTHQGIAFDTAGRLLDGQHRLWAIIVADLPVEMAVTRGMDRESFAVLDQHRVRSVADLAGDKWVTPRIVAIARAMSRGPLQSTIAPGRDDRNPTVLLAFIAQYREDIERVLALLPTQRRTRGASNLTAVVMGAILRASRHVSLKRLQRFIEVYTTGIEAAATETAAILLRDWVMTQKGAEASQVYRKTQRAMEAFMEGDPIQTLYAAQDDIYPLEVDHPQLPKLVRGRKLTETPVERRRQKAIKTRLRKEVHHG